MSRAQREANFIRESQALFPGVYDYTAMRGQYKNANTKVTLRCIQHDKTFDITPGNHKTKTVYGGCKIHRSEGQSLQHKMGLRKGPREYSGNSEKSSGKPPEKDVKKCSAKKKNGDPCSYKARPGNDLCGYHGKKDDEEEKEPELCGALKDDGEKCTNPVQFGSKWCGRHCKREEAKANRKMCSSKKKNGDPCPFPAQEGSDWCGKHRPKEERKASGIVECRINGCHNDVSGTDKKTCEPCLEKQRGDRVCSGRKQNGDPCSFKPIPDSDWCGKHQEWGKRQQDQANGIVECRGRGCHNNVAGTDNKACQACLEKERAKDQSRYAKRKERQSSEREMEKKDITCITCGDSFPSDLRTKNGLPSTKCESCLQKQRKVEESRPERDRREWSREYESRPERKAAKKQWREENPEKAKSYYRKYRNRQREKNLEDYLKRNAESQKTWRERNPEAWNDIVVRAKETGNYKLSFYKSCARDKDILVDLSDEDFLEMFRKDCWYCGSAASESDSLNGVDRLDSSGGYSKENCRPCCTGCNYSKGALSPDVFISQCARIVESANILPDEDVTRLSTLTTYSSLKGEPFEKVQHRAKRKGFEIDLTAEFHATLQKQSCYLCGNNPGPCGVDRVDNTQGYIMANCKPCCNLCNLMKRDESQDDFLHRCMRVVKTFLTFNQDIPSGGATSTDRMISRASSEMRNTASLKRHERMPIVDAHRSDMINWAGESWAIISSRVDVGKGSEKDIELMKEFNRRVEVDLLEAVKAKPPPKPKRKYTRRDPSLSKKELTRIRVAEWRAKQKEGAPVSQVGRPRITKNQAEARKRKTEKQKARRTAKKAKLGDVQKSKPGPKRKYQSEEERKAARAEQQRQRRKKQRMEKQRHATE